MSSPYFARIVQDIGEAGMQLTSLESTEGSAGNISVFTRQLRNLSEEFSERGVIRLPAEMPELADTWIVVTGSGRRLRDVIKQPEQNLVVLHVQPGGVHATWY